MSGKRLNEESSSQNTGASEVKKVKVDEYDTEDQRDKLWKSNDEYRKTWPRPPMEKTIDPTKDSISMIFYKCIEFV